MSDTTETDNRLRVLETAYAVQEVRTKHIEDQFDEIKRLLKETKEEVQSLKQTKDEHAGVFRIVTMVAAAAVSGLVAWVVGKF